MGKRKFPLGKWESNDNDKDETKLLGSYEINVMICMLLKQK